MITMSHVFWKLDLLLCINILGKASLAVAVRARMPSVYSLHVSFLVCHFCRYCRFLLESVKTDKNVTD